MRRNFLILTLLYLFFGVGIIYAIDKPNLISPQNNSIISSGSSFSWQSVLGSVEYNILIDDEPTVTSPYAKTPYYPTNPSYSPQSLNPGTYYWKVKAKDSDGLWGNWSDIWLFTLTNSTPSPNSSPSPTPTPISPSPTPSTSSSSPSSFTISNIPLQINSDQSFSVNITLSESNYPNTLFYLKGVFKEVNGSNYFGFTKVSGNWVKNGSSYSSQFPTTTNFSGNWSGILEVKPDPLDSGFLGTGNYMFKVGKYNSQDSSPSVSWSNDVAIKITQTFPTISTTTYSSPTQSTTTNTSSPPLPSTLIKSSVNSKVISEPNVKASSVSGVSKIATLSTASSTTSANVKSTNQKQISPFILIGLTLIVLGIGSLRYLILKQKRRYNPLK